MQTFRCAIRWLKQELGTSVTEVVVVDYGIGNVFSVCNALRQIGVETKLTRSLSEIQAADHLILPGVGAFGKAIEALKHYGLDDALARYKETERPFLGICIGMQLAMSESREFGAHQGLGFVDGMVERIPDAASDGKPLPVPHIAWSTITPPDGAASTWVSPPFEAFSEPGAAVYFVHSYHCVPKNDADLLAVASYGGRQVTAAIQSGSFTGVQFHPERSGPVGLCFLERFVSG